MSNQNLEAILDTLRFLHPNGEVFELCIISPLVDSVHWRGKAFGKKPIVAGWFNDPAKAANLAVQIKAEGIYTTLNPCTDALLARASQRLKANVDRTADNHIEQIKNLLIDIDPVRPAGISSTDQEHENALQMAKVLMAVLSNEGWPQALVGDSGNGAHLIYPIDLPNDEESKTLVKAVLKALSLKHQDHLSRLNIDVDQAVFNPARLTKLYGTMVRKGDNTQDRPHRVARIIALPETRQAVSMDLLKKLAASIPSQEKPQTNNIEAGAARLDVEAYLKRYGMEVMMVKPHGDGVLYCLQECLFDPSHNGNEAAIGQTSEGVLFYQCFHNSCKGGTWAEARAKISGQAKLTEFIIGARFKDSTQGKSEEQTTKANKAESSKISPPPLPLTPWRLAAQLFPRVPFPWEVLPIEIADSLQKLARACATSPYPLPGAGFCLLGSIMGRTLVVSPKEGWEAPMIFWHLDIRESGEGKTPPVRLMARALNEAQEKAEKDYRAAMNAYKQLSPKEQKKQQPPPPPRGYFVSDLTLEGLRDDLVNSPLGGLAVIQDEISAFLSGQNQYKSKGTDREAWLCLFDGHSARIVRVGKSIYISGSRVSIFGGIQPKVFRTFFAGDDGLYLSDGTLFRFLITCEPPSYFDLTPEAWSDQDRDNWDNLLNQALDWVDEKTSPDGNWVQPTRLILSTTAQEKFLEWRNRIFSSKDQLPLQLRGFLPKATEYVLRLTGIIHCMHTFSKGRSPMTVLTEEDLERGLKAAGFYLGQIQDALQLIAEEEYSPPEISERSLLLAQTLHQLRPHLHDGRLAIGFIHEQYNMMAPKTQKIGKPRGMGAVLRGVKLTISPGKHDANGHRGSKCLVWDKKTETFIEQRLDCLQCHKGKDWQGFEDEDIEEPMSAPSTASAGGFDYSPDIERMTGPETITSIRPQDNADVADMVEVEI